MNEKQKWVVKKMAITNKDSDQFNGQSVIQQLKD